MTSGPGPMPVSGMVEVWMRGGGEAACMTSGLGPKPVSGVVEEWKRGREARRVRQRTGPGTARGIGCVV